MVGGSGELQDFPPEMATVGYSFDMRCLGHGELGPGLRNGVDPRVMKPRLDVSQRPTQGIVDSNCQRGVVITVFEASWANHCD